MKDKKDNKKRLIDDMKVDPRLDKYLNMGLFQDKIDKANETVKKIGLPKFSK